MTDDGSILVNSARMPQPRQLGDVESTESLTHWWTCFRNYYCRDKYVRDFLVMTAVWDPADKANYGFEDETAELKRKKADVKEDLMAFMEIISSHMKHSYLLERLKTATKNITDVKNLIFKLYDAQLSQDTFMDLSNITKTSSETPHQFFERFACTLPST